MVKPLQKKNNRTTKFNVYKQFSKWRNIYIKRKHRVQTFIYECDIKDVKMFTGEKANHCYFNAVKL